MVAEHLLILIRTSYRLNSLAAVRIEPPFVFDHFFSATAISCKALTYSLNPSSDIHFMPSSFPELARHSSRTAFFRVLSVRYHAWIVFVHSPRVSYTVSEDRARPLGRYADQKSPRYRSS